MKPNDFVAVCCINLYTINLIVPQISYILNIDSFSYIQLTGGKIGDRLMAEAETNLAINVIPGMSDSYEVQGRGELQLGEFFF